MPAHHNTTSTRTQCFVRDTYSPRELAGDVDAELCDAGLLRSYPRSAAQDFGQPTLETLFTTAGPLATSQGVIL